MFPRFLILLAGLLILSEGVFSQKQAVLATYKRIQVYTTNQKCEELLEAKKQIDLAANDEQTSTWAKTWKYFGDVYFELAISNDDRCQSASDSALSLAYHAYVKALDLDDKNVYTADINTKLAVIGPYFLKFGVDAYNNDQYAYALGFFNKSINAAEIFDKIDSLGIYNAALSAEQLKKYSLAQEYYNRLIEIKYGGARIYSFLANAYLKSGDTTKNFSTILTGREMYPEDHDLLIEELNYHIEHDQYKDALVILESELEKEPKNATYLFYKATVHDNLGEYDAAEVAYRKCLSVKPDYFDALYNLGALLFNKGLDISDSAYRSNEVDEALLEKSRDYFRRALPHLEKANEINEYDQTTLRSLQKIYSILGDDEGYQRVTHELQN